MPGQEFGLFNVLTKEAAKPKMWELSSDTSEARLTIPVAIAVSEHANSTSFGYKTSDR